MTVGRLTAESLTQDVQRLFFAGNSDAALMALRAKKILQHCKMAKPFNLSEIVAPALSFQAWSQQSGYPCWQLSVGAPPKMPWRALLPPSVALTWEADKDHPTHQHIFACRASSGILAKIHGFSHHLYFSQALSLLQTRYVRLFSKISRTFEGQCCFPAISKDGDRVLFDFAPLVAPGASAYLSPDKPYILIEEMGNYSGGTSMLIGKGTSKFTFANLF